MRPPSGTSPVVDTKAAVTPFTFNFSLFTPMPTCIFPGKFQPFHEGHLMVVQGMMKACGNVTIVICDEKKKSADAPFTAEQRREMISAALLAKDIMDATIVVVDDGGEDAAWVTRVLSAADEPSDAMVWSGNEHVRALFEAAGVATKKIVPVPGIDGAEIRKLMAENNPNFRKHIPSGAIDVVMASRG